MADFVAEEVNVDAKPPAEARRRSVSPQTYYWNTFTVIKVDQFYFKFQEERLDGMERWLNVFTALTSSAAVGGWIIWQEVPVIWALIIGASNVVTGTRHLFPFRKALKAIESLSPEIDALALKTEDKWWSVSRGNLSDEEILELVAELRKRRSAAAATSFKGIVFKQHDKCLKKAEDAARKYMDALTEA